MPPKPQLSSALAKRQAGRPQLPVAASAAAQPPLHPPGQGQPVQQATTQSSVRPQQQQQEQAATQQIPTPANQQQAPAPTGQPSRKRQKRLTAETNRPPPGSLQYSTQHKYSITVAVRGGHVPSSWLERAEDYCKRFCRSGAFAVEIGGRAERVHLQGCIEMRGLTTKDFEKDLATHIKENFPIMRGTGGMVTAKAFAQGQKWSEMLGYIQKDQGKSTFQIKTHNVTDQDLEEGRNTYNIIRMDYEDGRTVLTKNNLTKAMWREYYTGLRPMPVPPDRILLWMMQSGKYVPAASWVITGQGQGLNYVQYSAMWDIIREPEKATLAEVQNLFFYQRGQGLTSLYTTHDPQWDMTYEEAKAMANDLREQQSSFVPKATNVHHGIQGQFADPTAMEESIAESSDRSDDCEEEQPLPSRILPSDVLLAVPAAELSTARIVQSRVISIGESHFSRAFVWVHKTLEVMSSSNDYEIVPDQVQGMLSIRDTRLLLRKYGACMYNELMSTRFSEVDDDTSHDGDDPDFVQYMDSYSD